MEITMKPEICRIKKTSTNSAARKSLVLTAVATLLLSGTALGGDWPTRLRDNLRSGVTTEQLQLPLAQAWNYATNRAPRPAWGESSSEQDYWHEFSNMKPREWFDLSFDVAVVGNYLYFGSRLTAIKWFA